MQQVFLDTNVFLDAILQRNDAARCDEILSLAQRREISIKTSSSILVTVIYFLQKAQLDAATIIAVIDKLLKVVSLQSPFEKTFSNALHAGFPDLEDAVQYFTASQVDDMDYFITSNTKDFKKATAQLPVLTPAAFIKTVQ